MKEFLLFGVVWCLDGGMLVLVCCLVVWIRLVWVISCYEVLVVYGVLICRDVFFMVVYCLVRWFGLLVWLGVCCVLRHVKCCSGV